jgi:hypothetical protein
MIESEQAIAEESVRIASMRGAYATTRCSQKDIERIRAVFEGVQEGVEGHLAAIQRIESNYRTLGENISELAAAYQALVDEFLKRVNTCEIMDNMLDCNEETAKVFLQLAEAAARAEHLVKRQELLGNWWLVKGQFKKQYNHL